MTREIDGDDASSFLKSVVALLFVMLVISFVSSIVAVAIVKASHQDQGVVEQRQEPETKERRIVKIARWLWEKD